MASPPHLHHHPPPTATTMKPVDLEITVVSAKHLKNVNWRHGDLKPYAVAYLDPERRAATKPDDAGSTRPVWNERLNLPLPFSSNDPSLSLTIDVFHSKPSETPKPLVGTVRFPLKDLIDLEASFSSGSTNPIKTLELRRPSGRPQGKIRIKLAIRERPAPPPEPNYQFAPPPSGYYYSTAPPHPTRDYRTFSPPPPPLPHAPYNPYGSYSDPYSGYYSSAAPPYYSAPPAPAPAPAPAPTRSPYYDRASGYSGPSAPVDYASVPLSSSYDQRAKGGRFGMGTGLAVGAVAGALGGLALEEGIKYEEEKVAERVESDLATRDDYSDYRADYRKYQQSDQRNKEEKIEEAHKMEDRVSGGRNYVRLSLQFPGNQALATSCKHEIALTKDDCAGGVPARGTTAPLLIASPSISSSSLLSPLVRARVDGDRTLHVEWPLQVGLLAFSMFRSAPEEQQRIRTRNREGKMAPSLSSYLGSSVTVLSNCTIYPDSTTTIEDIRLSVSDLPMLSCHYIQKGLFFSRPPVPIDFLISRLKSTLSLSLSLFPALAGRLVTLPDGRIMISCNDSGAEFTHAVAPSFNLSLLLPSSSDVPPIVRSLFPHEGVLSFDGHFRPLAAFQLTELDDGAVFLGCAVNHAVVDGTSFWNFVNTWADLFRGGAPKPPSCIRDYFGGSKAVLRFPGSGRPENIFPVNTPLRERFFHFSREAMQDLKSRANRWPKIKLAIGAEQNGEIYGKLAHDPRRAATEISSFQSLCALLWRSVTRGRKWLAADATTTFRMAVNCRHRVSPRVAADYFGNAIQSVATRAAVGEVVGKDLPSSAALLHENVASHGDATVRSAVEEWEAAPRCFPLGNPDGAGITMGSSHRFPVYEGNDFGWGPPLAVRSGKANKFDGKMSAFPGREGGGSVDLEVCLAPETMAALLQDEEFMSYVSEDKLPLTAP
ncbi:uncharacterized protein [Typha latifolia]|uniref:uncharacterized protein n=1 Tax=Typha latifolia TaxID=4733 RepID=UPI003C2B67B8